MNTEKSALPMAATLGLVAAVATAQEKRADNDPLKNVDADKRDATFTASPTPWKEVAKMTYGGDRTFASTIQTLVLDASPSQYPTFERDLLKVLQDPDCTDAGREFVCRMLYYVGSEKCIPALAPMLADEKQSHMARYALQPIQDPAVDQCFRGALGIVKGNVKAGLIGTIGLRGDAQAVEALRAIQANTGEPAVVREAAQLALARIDKNNK